MSTMVSLENLMVLRFNISMQLFMVELRKAVIEATNLYQIMQITQIFITGKIK